MKLHDVALWSRIFKVVLGLCIATSIALIYYEKVVRENYHVLTLPDGPDTSDYFEE